MSEALMRGSRTSGVSPRRGPAGHASRRRGDGRRRPAGTGGRVGQRCGRHPPMGWNSYDSFNWSVTEADVRANADYMATNLRQFGWEYVVIDWAWYYPVGTTQPQPGRSLQPRLRMDANGRLLPDTTGSLRRRRERVQAAGRPRPWAG
ncbi:hypothetical protein NKG94_48980 [Micromonospora sp. M12]